MPILSIYSKPNCSNCVRAKMMILRSKLPYKEIDITRDEDSLSMLLNSGFQSAPVIYIDDKPLGTITDLEMGLRSGELLRIMGIERKAA